MHKLNIRNYVMLTEIKNFQTRIRNIFIFFRNHIFDTANLIKHMPCYIY